MKVGELPQHIAVFGIQAFEKCGIVELGLTVCLAHVPQRKQPLQDGLTPLRRHLLPAREQRLPDVSLLFGSHPLPDVLPVAQSLLLAGGQSVPGLKALANLRLLFGRQA